MFLNLCRIQSLISVHAILRTLQSIRRRYEKGHWDSVIVKYKETELIDEPELLSPESKSVLEKVRQHLEECHLTHKPHFTWLPCHAIDLHKDGELNAHVDSVRFSGDIVSGLSLLSPSIMRLLPDGGENGVSEEDGSTSQDTTKGYMDMYLPPGSLHVLSGPARYQYSHQLLPSGSVFDNGVDPPVSVLRDRRLSIIFRDAK